jgi:hypothetical protein
MRFGIRLGRRTLRLPLALLALGIGLARPPQASAQAWPGFSRDPQHTGVSLVASQYPQQVRWSTPVDLNPQYSSDGSLLTHYGSPLITSGNTVLIPVKLDAYGGFRIEAREGSTGKLIWQLGSSYQFPVTGWNWIPVWGPTLRPNDKSLAYPDAGGIVRIRPNPDSSSGFAIRMAFYGLANYRRNPQAFHEAIQICTPLTSDAEGNLYFGFYSTGAALPGYDQGIPSGLARLTRWGQGTFVAARLLSGDARFDKIAYNCAPALSNDGSSVYIAVNSGAWSPGYLCRVDSFTLEPQGRVFLIDPKDGGGASISNSSTASPTIGPDGDVYYGVLERRFGSNNARGWLLHYNATLTAAKTPGAFGWDDTASIVPASAVPSYTGDSSYLLLTKYNNYANWGIGGDGRNRLAILDPNGTQIDPISGVTVMREVLTILSPTPEPELGDQAVREWCINSAAVDPLGRCAIVNCADGNVYRWDFATNTLSDPVNLAPPTGEAYTTTLVGPDGAIYAINNAVLNCCEARPDTSFPGALESLAGAGEEGTAGTDNRPGANRERILNLRDGKRTVRIRK